MRTPWPTANHWRPLYDGDDHARTFVIDDGSSAARSSRLPLVSLTLPDTRPHRLRRRGEGPPLSARWRKRGLPTLLHKDNVGYMHDRVLHTGRRALPALCLAPRAGGLMSSACAVWAFGDGLLERAIGRSCSATAGTRF